MICSAINKCAAFPACRARSAHATGTNKTDTITEAEAGGELETWRATGLRFKGGLQDTLLDTVVAHPNPQISFQLAQC